MKRLRFNRYNDWMNISLIVLAILGVFSGIFEFFGETKTEWNKVMSKIGSIALVLYFARQLFGKNYVGWNNVGITIKINSYLGKSFNFKDVKSTSLENGVLSIILRTGKNNEFNVDQIENSDIKKLTKIITENTVANNGYNSAC